MGRHAVSLEGKDLILKDLEHFEESLRYSEEVGEKRFSFFVGLATAVGAGIVALLTSDKVSGKVVAPIIDLAFVLLVVIGFLTYLRMLQRNRTTDEHKATLGYLRRQYARLCPELEAAHYRVPVMSASSNLSKWARGGYAETIGLIEGLLVALYLYHAPNVPRMLSIGIGAVVSGCLYYVAVRRDLKRDVYFRTGVGAVIADANDRVLLLQRSGSRGNDGWQFLQGGLHDDEDIDRAIAREIKEETSIEAEDLALVEWYPEPLVYELPEEMRKTKTGRGQVQYWSLFRIRRDMPPLKLPRGEFQAAAWRTFDEAVTSAAGFRQPIYRRIQQRFEPRLRGVAPVPAGQAHRTKEVIRFVVSEEPA
jgi:putative (di)nucleoside polyphosphate hydrolase